MTDPEKPQIDEAALKPPDEPVCPDDGGEKLLEQIARLESKVGQDMEARKAYARQLKKYLKSHRKELDSLVRMRKWGVGFAYLLIFVLIGTFVCVTFFESKVFATFTGGAKTAFIIATVSGSVILMGIILRGLFGTRHRELLPGNLQQYVDAAKDVFLDGK